MTCILSGLLSVVVLSAPPQPMGLMLGIPPAPEDPVILRVAPEKCAFYVNWMGTAAPDPKSSSQTEWLLAEPEVQQLLDAVAHSVGGDTVSRSAGSEVSRATGVPTNRLSPRAAGAAPVVAVIRPGPDLDSPPTSPPPAMPVPAAPSKPKTEQEDAKAEEIVKRRQKLRDELSKCLLMRPAAIFLSDCKSGASPADWRGGMVVNFGKDAPRLCRAIDAEIRAQKTEANGSQDPDQARWNSIKIAGRKWHRYSHKDAASVIVGFQGDYLIVGLGRPSVEGILDRMHRDPPAWLMAAMKRLPVPRRTGIIYIDVRTFGEVIPARADLKELGALFDLLGLDNAKTFISTTGLEDSGMINRALLSFRGKPHGLLGLVSERPLRTADIDLLPQDSSVAMAVRVDPLAAPDALGRLLKFYEADGDVKALLKDYAIDSIGLLASMGDTWRVYNSPGQGGLALTGLTFVAPLRDRPRMFKVVDKIQAAAKKIADKTSSTHPIDVKTLQFGKNKIFYIDCEVCWPAWCITDRELVVSLNLYNLKAYLTRRNDRGLAAVPEVVEAMRDGGGPALLGYCDTPRLFDLGYPLVSMFALSSEGSLLEEFGIPKIDPAKWPSAAAIRPHLRPDLTAIERTSDGLQITCRYCFPSGGVNGTAAAVACAFRSAVFDDAMEMLGFPKSTSAATEANNPVGRQLRAVDQARRLAVQREVPAGLDTDPLFRALVAEGRTRAASATNLRTRLRRVVGKSEKPVTLEFAPLWQPERPPPAPAPPK